MFVKVVTDINTILNDKNKNELIPLLKYYNIYNKNKDKTKKKVINKLKKYFNNHGLDPLLIKSECNFTTFKMLVEKRTDFCNKISDPNVLSNWCAGCLQPNSDKRCGNIF